MSLIPVLPDTRPPRMDGPSRGGRVRSALCNLVFVLALLGLVAASWMWGPKFSVVLSHSMDPTYTTGDALLVIPWGHPGIGDIAQFSVPLAPGQAQTTIPVAHRIIGQDERGFITKGDNSLANPDYWRVTPDMITGEIVWWLPQVWMFRLAAALIGIAVLMFMWPRREDALTDSLSEPGRYPWLVDGAPITLRVKAIARVDDYPSLIPRTRIPADGDRS